MTRKVCSECGTPQQWELWPMCTCGGKFIAPPGYVASHKPSNEWSALELDEIRTRREQLHKAFKNAPRRSLAFLTFAIALSAFYKPALNAVLMAIPISFVGGLFSVYGALSKRGWPSFLYLLSLPPILRIADRYDMGIEGQYFALLGWMAFSLSAPFWIWRRQGLAMYGSFEHQGPESISAPQVQ